MCFILLNIKFKIYDLCVCLNFLIEESSQVDYFDYKNISIALDNLLSYSTWVELDTIVNFDRYCHILDLEIMNQY